MQAQTVRLKWAIAVIHGKRWIRGLQQVTTCIQSCKGYDMSEPTHSLNPADFRVQRAFAQPSYSAQGAYGTAVWPESPSSSAVSKPTEFLLRSLSTVASAFVLSDKVSRDSLCAQYRLKLRSYEYRVAPFLLSTVPPILALIPIFFAYKAIRAVRHTF